VAAYAGGVAIGAVVLALILLAVPLDVAWHAESARRLAWAVRVRWLFGLVRVERASGGKRTEVRAEAEAGRASGASGRRRARRAPAGFLGDGALLRRTLRLLRSLRGGIRFRRLDAELRLGTGDPAETGRLLGILLPFVAYLRPRMPGNVLVVPDFQAPRLEANGGGEVRVVPLLLVGPVVSFGAWIGWRAVRKRRRA
jgi:hypothetical protein